MNTVNAIGEWRYDVSVVYPADVTGDWASGLTNQVLTGAGALTDNLLNSGTDVQTVVYTFTPHINPGDSDPECQNGVPVVISIEINPRPRITVTTDLVLCYDDAAVFDITKLNTVNAIGEWRYDVSVVYPADVTGDWASGLTNQVLTGAGALTDNLLNSGTDVQTVVYTFTPHINPGDSDPECQNGVPVVISIEINPRPTIAVTSDLILCYDDAAVFDITKLNTVNAIGEWRYDVSVVYPADVTGDWASGLTNQVLTGAGALTDNLLNSGTDVQTVVYTFTPHINPGDSDPECQNGVPVVISIEINPRPTIAVTSDLILCYDDAAVFDITKLNTVNAIGEWRYDVSVVYPADVTGDWASGLTNQVLTGAGALTDNLLNSGTDVQTVVYTFTPHINPGDSDPECQNGVPVVISIEINPRPTIAVTSDLILCYDDAAVFDITKLNTVNAIGEWRYDVSVVYPADVTGDWASGLTNQVLTGAGALTDNLLNSGTDVQTVVYTFTPHINPGDSDPECQNGVPVVISIEINPRPTIAVTSDLILCYDDAAVFDITKLNTVNAIGEWRYDVSVVYPADVTGDWASGLTNQVLTGAGALTDNLLNSGTDVQTVVYTFTPHINPGDSDPECQNGVPVVISIEINPRPTIAVTSDLILCYDDAAVFDISTVNTVNAAGEWRYDVSVVYPAGVTGDWAAGLFNETLTGIGIQTDNLTNNTNTVQTVTYTFTPHIQQGDGDPDCQNGVPVVISIEINPRPRITVTTDPVLCYDGDAVFDISTVNTVNAAGEWRYDVSVVYPAGVTGDWAAGLFNETLTGIGIQTDNLTNNTNTVQTVVYTFTPHIDPGDGDPDCQNGVPVVIDIEINPRPRITVTTDPVLCYDGDAVFDISTVNTVNAAGEWRYDVSVVYPADVTGDWASGLTNQVLTGAGALTDNLLNSGTDVQTVVYTFTPHINPGDSDPECQNGVPVVISIEINPRPRITVTTDPVLCYDGDAVFDISTVNTVNAAGEWRYDVSVVYPAGVTGDWAAGLFNETLTGIGIQTDNLTNNTNTVQTVTYTFTPHIQQGDGDPDCQNGVPVVISIEINPRPRITVTTDPVLCYDGDAVFDISTVNTVNAAGEWRYDVSVVYPAGVTGDWAAGLFNETLTGIGIQTDNLTNNTNTVQTVTYTFTPHIDPGDGDPDCQNGVPVVIDIEINPRPRITVTTDPVLCYDGDAVFDISTVNTVNAAGEWRYDVSVVYPAGVTGDWAAGLFNETLAGIGIQTDNLTNNTNTVQTVTYTFTPHIDPGDGDPDCQNGVPVVIDIEINPRPRITVTTDPVLCYDGDAVFDISTVNTVNAAGEWRYDVSVVYPAGVTGDWAAGLFNETLTGIGIQTDNLTNNTNTVQTVTYTFTPHIQQGDGDPDCQNGVPVVISIEINPRPRITVTTDPVLCYDGDAVFDISTVNTVNAAGEWRYDVSVVYPAGVTGDWAAGLFNETLAGIGIQTDNLTNNTNTVQTVTYTFTPHIDPGDGDPDCQNGVPVVIDIEINPRPRITVTTDPVLCYDGDAVFDISTVNTVNAAGEWRYDVSVVYPAGVTGDWAAGLFNETLTGIGIQTDNLTNNTNTVQTVTYTFTPHIQQGDGDPDCQNGVPVVISIEINPRPRITVTTDPVLCYDGDAVFDISTVNTVNAAGEWRYDVSVVYPAGVTGDWAAGLFNETLTGIGIQTDNLTNNTNTVRTVTYTFTPHIRPGDGDRSVRTVYL